MLINTVTVLSWIVFTLGWLSGWPADLAELETGVVLVFFTLFGFFGQVPSV